MSNNKKIIKGAIMSYMMIGVNIISSMVYTPWIVRNLGQSNYAIYTLAMSIIPMLMVDFGFNSILSRYVAKYKAEENKDEINRIVSFCYKFFIFLDIVITMILIIVYFNLKNIYNKLTLIEIENLQISFAIIAIFSIITFLFNPLKSVLTAFEEFASVKSVDIINKLVSMILVFIALIFGFGLISLVIITSVTNLLSSIVFYFLVKKKCNVKYVNYKYNKNFYKEIFVWSFYSTIAGYASLMIYNVVPSILTIVSTVESVAIFGVVNNFEGYVYIFTSALSGLFMPRVSGITLRQKKNKDSTELTDLMIKVGRIQLVIIGLILCGYTLIGKEFMITWMGQEYEDAFMCTLLIILPTFIEIPQTIASTSIITAGYIKEWAIVRVTIAMINIVFCSILGYYFGVYGASMSILIAYIVRTTMLNYLYHKKMLINLKRFFKETYKSFIITFIVTLSFGGFFINFISLNGWISIVIKSFIILVIYFTSMYITALNIYEKNLIIKIKDKIILLFK